MSGVRGGWCVDRGGRLRFIKVATQIATPDRALARSRPCSGRGSFLRRAAHQARIGPCVALFVGISTAGNRPMSTNWRHAAAGRAGLHTPPDPLGARRWDHAPGQYGASSSSSYEPWLS